MGEVWTGSKGLVSALLRPLNDGERMVRFSFNGKDSGKLATPWYGSAAGCDPGSGLRTPSAG
jgi:hypothetical protein